MSDLLGVKISDDKLEELICDIEERFGTTMGLGVIVDDKAFCQWLDEAKAKIDPFYWNRYRQLLVSKELPLDVVTAIDEVTDRILACLGNPGLSGAWDRCGMVVGHVQSDKTAN